MASQKDAMQTFREYSWARKNGVNGRHMYQLDRRATILGATGRNNSAAGGGAGIIVQLLEDPQTKNIVVMATTKGGSVATAGAYVYDKLIILILAKIGKDWKVRLLNQNIRCRWHWCQDESDSPPAGSGRQTIYNHHRNNRCGIARQSSCIGCWYW